MSQQSIPTVQVRNGEVVTLSSIEPLSNESFFAAIRYEIQRRSRLCSFFGYNFTPTEIRFLAVLGSDENGICSLFSTRVDSAQTSLTPQVSQAHLFEREISEQFAIPFTGHPRCNPVRFAQQTFPGSKNKKYENRIGDIDFFSVEGDQVHEVAVGPVHAGIIEPGHFRFQCHGEEVFHLEISLGYQYRGIEENLCGSNDAKQCALMEVVAGDTTIGHTTAYCQAIESLCNTAISLRSQAVRAVASELERCANHCGDLGALCGDVGYLPGASFCGRIRGDFLNMSALICGNRFGRGLVVPGGGNFDIDKDIFEELRKRLQNAAEDMKNAAELIFSNVSVQARFEHQGILDDRQCWDLGIVGMAARASGVLRDVRQDYPYGMYRFSHIPVMSGVRGDIFDRASIRWREIQQSLQFIEEQLESLPNGAMKTPLQPLMPDALVVSLIEGWRGEICHTAITDNNGKLCRYKIVDPSFHNWTGLAVALRTMQISDFPLCNKSFNLSYCGHDL
ncbi:MAG: hypothetical protein JW795_22985 [Chitinivibrionales bacterium]|nr:hypothetical protein [Chitinivibrionales bacterium]